MASPNTLRNRSYQKLPRSAWPGAGKRMGDKQSRARARLNRAELTPAERFQRWMWIGGGKP